MLTVLLVTVASTLAFRPVPAGAVPTAVSGVGSSYVAPELYTWISNTQQAPYNLDVNYSSSSSGQGRYEFTNGTIDFAATDITYGLGSLDTNPPSFPFIYVPIAAAGIAFIYNIPGLTRTLRLDSYETCSILTGGITKWDDPAIAASNPGVALPDLTIRPMTETDASSTNYAVESWCMSVQPSLWSAFANFINHQAGNTVPIDPNTPEPEWPPLSNGLSSDSTAAVTSNVVNNPGGIGAVEAQYAADVGFNSGNPARGVASELNASGDYAQPTGIGVDSALAYATQNLDGSPRLDFNGIGPHVYNPSTYSYLLVPSTGWSTSKGAAMSAFLNYALTLGQEKAPSFYYPALALSLERFGIAEVQQHVPGAVPLTAAEAAFLNCGDMTPSAVAAGYTSPTCVTPSSPPPLPPPPVATNGSLPAPIVGMATAPDGSGYWLADAQGGVSPHGDAPSYGSMAGRPLNAPITHIVATADGKGYWLIAADGGTFAFGDAGFYGSMGGAHLDAPVVAIAPTKDGRGYWLVGSDGGIFAFGDAGFEGSMGGQPLSRPVVGINADDSTGGYWLLASDGGIFAFGAPFFGSTGALTLDQPVDGMATTADNRGYWLVASDGGVFAFGDATFRGSTGGTPLNAPIVGMGADSASGGYWLGAADGGVFSYGAPFWGAD